VHLPAQILNDRITLIAALLLIATLLLAIRSARWRALQDVPGRMHLVAGGAVACLMLWLLNIHLADGLVMHFLGVTTLTLVVGWSFSVIAACAVLVGFYLIQGLEWSAFPVSACLTVLLPATLTRLLARLLYRPRLRHLFIYILGAGFAGGGLVVLALAVSTVALLALLGQHERVELALQWWPLICLLMFSEAFINGMCISALAIFRPDAVKTFDDAFYLDDQ
jgi:uncharacterized membrane protein